MNDVLGVNTQGNMTINATQQVPVDQTAAAAAGTRATFLLLVVVVSLMGNTGIVIAIGMNDRLKQNPMNLFMLNIACVLISDTILNLPLILGSSISGYWPMGEFMCRYNAFFVQVMDIEILLGLTLLALDRLVAAKSSHKYPEQFSRLKINLLICISWTQAIVFAFPLFVNGIHSQYYNSRYLCAISSGANLVYLVMTSVVCFIFPVSLTFVAYIIVIRVGVKEKLRVRALNTQLHYANDFHVQPILWEEMRLARFAGTLQIFWFILCGPYLVINAISQYKNVPIIESSDIMFNYSSDMETAFTWMKLSFLAVTPILTYIIRREIWQTLKLILTCSRDTAVGTSSQNVTPIHDQVKQSKAIIHTVVEPATAPPTSEKKFPLRNLGYQVPVLFATANGLRLQIGNNFEENDVAERDVFNSDIYNSKGSSTDYESTLNSTRTAELGLTGDLESNRFSRHGYQMRKPSYEESERMQNKSVLSKSEIKFERRTPTTPRKSSSKSPRF